MTYFYRFAVWFLEFHIAIAEAAPWQNRKHICELREELWYWRGCLDREEINRGAPL